MCPKCQFDFNCLHAPYGLEQSHRPHVRSGTLAETSYEFDLFKTFHGLSIGGLVTKERTMSLLPEDRSCSTMKPE